MAHYTKHYDGHRAAKHEAALVDCRHWLGKSNYMRVVEGIRNDFKLLQVNNAPYSAVKSCYKQTILGLALFGGIEGLPAYALVREAIRGGIQ